MNDVPVQESASCDSLVGQVADEFLARLERGESPDVEEYARRHPEVGALLRQVLASLRAIRAAPPSPLRAPRPY